MTVRRGVRAVATFRPAVPVELSGGIRDGSDIRDREAQGEA